MIISKSELKDLYESVFERQESIKEINSEITEDLKGYAETNELELKAVKEGYKLYKKYRSGKLDPEDSGYFEIIDAVEEFFA